MQIGQDKLTCYFYPESCVNHFEVLMITLGLSVCAIILAILILHILNLQDKKGDINGRIYKR